MVLLEEPRSVEQDDAASRGRSPRRRRAARAPEHQRDVEPKMRRDRPSSSFLKKL